MTGADVPVFECETVFDAPLERVWELHTSGEGLRRLTPSIFDLRIEEVRGAGPADPLPDGAEIDVSTNPGGVGSRDTWTAVVEASECDGEAPVFRDRMRDGAFPEWVHTHRFETVFGDETLMRDRIEYRLPTVLGPLVGRFGAVGFVPVFSYRHRRAAGILES